ncbi:MAG TPA: SusD/RagB family nutrient-binding outer membrane lipoprotein [Chitinophagaceae bacterium]|nr:SusD/RagB family nutrient-binding outer membrane lipoprotein [Chitinophagaceae bacterium]
MKFSKYILVFSMAIIAMGSCKKQTFVDLNVDPTTLLSVDPKQQFLQAASKLPNDFEYYYDVYRSLMPWLQYSTGVAGNGSGFTNPSSKFNYRYGNFYGNVGTPLADIPQLIAKMTPDEQAARVYEKNIAAIYKAYYAFYVSDINGSIPYTQAFQSRYGGTLTPTYDAQPTLFDTLDAQIKKAVTALETNQPVTQLLYGNFDPFFGGVALQWAKAGNALRLKIAMRLMKRDPNKLKTIATEVIADANQMSSVADSWVLSTGASFADAGGNFNPSGFLAARPVVDFMKAKADPRLRLFYRPNGKGIYIGSPTAPDTAKLPAYQALYAGSDTAFSTLQQRLFTPNYNDGTGAGTGDGFYPVLTYAEYCFIRAELGARAITNDAAATWYTKGVTASINFYDQRAGKAKVTGYNAVTPAEITAYLAMPGITYDPAKGIEQIACQAYLDFYRQPSEAWAWWKRTGYPNTTSVLAWAPLYSNGTALTLTRRASLQLAAPGDANYTNQKAAYDAMATDPDFGSGPADAYGRVWWDKK